MCSKKVDEEVHIAESQIIEAINAYTEPQITRQIAARLQIKYDVCPICEASIVIVGEKKDKKWWCGKCKFSMPSTDKEKEIKHIEGLKNGLWNYFYQKDLALTGVLEEKHNTVVQRLEAKIRSLEAK